MSRALALVVIAAAACGGRSGAATERWFVERGLRAPTWHTCTRIGSWLRSTCSGDHACEARVTEDVTRPCYAGHYRADQHHGRSPVAPAGTPSPCFWDRSPSPPASTAAFAQAECAALSLEPALVPHCTAELRAVVDDLCKRGSPELTGAGP